VWEGGDGAVLASTREFDTGGAEPKPLLVSPEELDAAIKTLPLDLVAGLQVAIANVAQVAQAGIETDTIVDLPQGQRVTLGELPVCAPPGPDTQIDATILGTCRLLGVERVYRMGGAQAIAALALGTESVARVDVIVGPGNVYVQEAKRQLSARVGIDGFAGPSDLLIALGADAGEHELRLAAL